MDDHELQRVLESAREGKVTGAVLTRTLLNHIENLTQAYRQAVEDRDRWKAQAERMEALNRPAPAGRLAATQSIDPQVYHGTLCYPQAGGGQ